MIRVYVTFRPKSAEGHIRQVVKTTMHINGNLPVHAFSLLLRARARELGTDTHFTIDRMEEDK